MGGVFSDGDREELVRNEKRRRAFFAAREESWRLKSRAIWLICGDENTKFFQAYSKGRKNKNTI